MRISNMAWGVLFFGALSLTSTVRGQDDFERAPIQYSLSTPDNVISLLEKRLERGEVQLKHENRQGYLPALLAELAVPIPSQTLVFSKTSLQRHRISPQTPRAIYFNDDVYVGYCQSGDVLEISAADPKLGTVFYTLDQKNENRPIFTRQTDNCLICHSSSRTGSVPGHLVRSMSVDSGGQPILSAGSQSVDHTTPFEKRWGGWFVSGTHGAQTHMGNFFFRSEENPDRIDRTAGQNVTELNRIVDLDHYPSAHSDIVALMVLEHQTLVHNRLTQANFVTRQALDYDAMMRKLMETPKGEQLESTTRRIAGAGDALVDALLLVDEAKLTSPVSGTSGFVVEFMRRGPQDDRGRSLREFDLHQRVFKYPCSYLIYSRAFDELPGEVREYTWKRLWGILSGEIEPEKYSYLSTDDRQAIREIIRDTKTGLPAFWK